MYFQYVFLFFPNNYLNNGRNNDNFPKFKLDFVYNVDVVVWMLRVSCDIRKHDSVALNCHDHVHLLHDFKADPL